MITRLAFYDFDHTLFNSPHPEEGKLIWKEKTGEDWPHKGWWYQADSLNPEVFDLVPYSNVVNDVNKDNADPNTYTVLLTGRMVNMLDDIKNILDSHGIHFDDYNLAKKPEESKVERIKVYLGNFPAVNDVIVYDDRDKELIKFKEFKDRLRIFGVNFEIQKADKGALSLIESKFIEEIEKNSLNEGVNLEKIRIFVSSFKNKGNVFMGIIDKLNNITNTRIKKYLITTMLLLAFGQKIGNADAFINTVAEKLSFEKITSVNDFIFKTKNLVKQDETLLDAIKPLIPQNIIGDPSLTKNIAVENNLIDAVFKLDQDMINQLAGVNKKRFTSKYLDRYNQFDDKIEGALNSLIEIGERPNMSLIKAIMMIETGMIPRKNSLGFRGFPQTKMKFVRPINKKFGTKFSMKDLDDPEKSAQFIHYYLKALEPLHYVNNIEDYAASYNWGVGNYKKYLEGKKEMPEETKEYINLAKIMLNKVKKDSDEKKS